MTARRSPEAEAAFEEIIRVLRPPESVELVKRYPINLRRLRQLCGPWRWRKDGKR